MPTRKSLREKAERWDWGNWITCIIGRISLESTGCSANPGFGRGFYFFYRVGCGRDIVVEVKWAGIWMEGKISGGKCKSEMG